MITLDRLEQKIDTFAINQVQVCKALDALAESQGKLLARLDAMDAGLHETAMRNHQQIRALLDEHDSKFTEHFTALFDGNAAVVGKFNEFIDKIKQAAKPRKKARRRQER